MLKDKFFLSFVFLILGLITILVSGIYGLKGSSISDYLLIIGVLFLVLSLTIFVLNKNKN